MLLEIVSKTSRYKSNMLATSNKYVAHRDFFQIVLELAKTTALPLGGFGL